jgi:predicted alpha/beta-fold hydrolase
MLDLDWGCPFLFLYSADDPLCDVRKLEELINDKRQRCAREARALGCAAVSLT